MTTATIPPRAVVESRVIAREADADRTNFTTVARCRADARRWVTYADRFHAGDTGNLATGTTFTLTAADARGLAYAAMAALGREDALDMNGHPYRSSYPLGVPYADRPNVKVGPYVNDAVDHVLRDRADITPADRELVLRLALLANVTFRL